MNKTEVLLQNILKELQTMNENITQLARVMKSNLSESRKTKRAKSQQLLVESKQGAEVNVREAVQRILKQPLDKLVESISKEDLEKGKSR